MRVDKSAPQTPVNSGVSKHLGDRFALTHPDAALIAHEAELEALVLEWQQLDAAWPKGKTPMERWQIGRRHQAYLIRIRELHRDIAEAEAKTLAGAAVQLRRLRAVLDDESSVVEGLLEGALKVIEMAVSSQPLRAGG